MSETLQTVFKNSGAELLSYNCQEALPGVVTMTVNAAGALIEEEPDFVSSLLAAIVAVTAFAQDTP